MSFIDDMKIGKKVIGGFLIVALIFVVVAAIGYSRMGTMATADTELYQGRTLPVEQLGSVDADFQQMRAELYRYIYIPSSRPTFDATITELRGNIKKNMDAYRATSLTGEEKTNLAKFDTNYAAFSTQYDATIASADKNDMKAVDAALAAGSPLITARTGTVTAYQALIDVNIAEANKLAKTNQALASSSSLMMIIATIIGLVIAIALGLFLSKSITGPIDIANKNLKELGNGHLGNRLKMNRKDEIGEMATTMDAFSDDLQTNVVGVMKKISAGQFKMQYLKPKDNQDEITPALIDTLKAVLELTAETSKLSSAAVEGKLDTRADVTKLKGDYRKIVEGVNTTLDAVIGPLNVAAEYVDRISKGDIPAKITDNYNGDFNEIKNNLNVCIGSISALVADAAMLRTAAIDGKLDTRADASKHQGDYKKIVQGVDDCLDAVIGPLNVAAEYVDRISKGDIPPKITDNYNGDFNEIKSNLNNCIGSINMLVADAHMLEKAAVDGNLATRADTTKHHGDYKKIVVGVNSCLDSVIGPLNVAADYVDKISKGAIPAKITDPYNGDFNIIKGNLNTCIDSINALVADAGMLRTAAIEGKLDTRADASKHKGDYRKIVEGVNGTLDAVIGPLNVTAEYVDRISKGDIPPKITDNYNGDFNEIKNNLNNCIDVMNGLLAETNGLIKATKEGKLDTRGNSQKFPGGWGSLVGGVNELVDAFVHPINVTAEYVDRISKGDIPPKITDTYNGDFNEIKNNLNNCIDVMNGLLAETNGLIKATKEGKLDTRGNSQKFPGGWGSLVGGVNELVDAFVHPINVTAEYVDRISKGDIPPKITDTY
ncbi:MAG: MCP four helix bundle domain-containing protein, partial [Methanomicrobiales archaeon]